MSCIFRLTFIYYYYFMPRSCPFRWNFHAIRTLVTLTHTVFPNDVDKRRRSALGRNNRLRLRLMCCRSSTVQYRLNEQITPNNRLRYDFDREICLEFIKSKLSVKSVFHFNVIIIIIYYYQIKYDHAELHEEYYI